MKPTDENLLAYLQQNRTKEQLVLQFQVSERWIRQRIASLIEKGHAIKSFNSEPGYRLLDAKISADRRAIELTVRDLKAKAKTTMQRAEAIQNRYQLKIEFETEQLPKLSEVQEAEIGKRYLTDDGVVVECAEGYCVGCFFDDSGKCPQTISGWFLCSDGAYFKKP